ncbi:hypothetical protein [Oceanicola sp. 22II-s10i]|nr:hypothetical protein [Oceanicola sp. 22II-s10i]
MIKFGRGLTAQELVDHIDLHLEAARDDAHSHGGLADGRPDGPD